MGVASEASLARGPLTTDYRQRRALRGHLQDSAHEDTEDHCSTDARTRGGLGRRARRGAGECEQRCEDAGRDRAASDEGHAMALVEAVVLRRRALARRRERSRCADHRELASDARHRAPGDALGRD